MEQQNRPENSEQYGLDSPPALYGDDRPDPPRKRSSPPLLLWVIILALAVGLIYYLVSRPNEALSPEDSSATVETNGASQGHSPLEEVDPEAYVLPGIPSGEMDLTSPGTFSPPSNSDDDIQYLPSTPSYGTIETEPTDSAGEVGHPMAPAAETSGEQSAASTSATVTSEAAKASSQAVSQLPGSETGDPSVQGTSAESGQTNGASALSSPEGATGSSTRALARATEANSRQSASTTSTGSPGNRQGAQTAAPLPEISDKWVVNISSTTDPEESARIWNKVSGQDVGGQVYTYKTTLEGRLYHRIRVGFFNSREESEKVGLKIQETFNLTALPWAVQPNVDEVRRFMKEEPQP